MGLEQLTYLNETREPLVLTDYRTKVDVAIWVIQAYEPPQGYYLADSGGKDSALVRDLMFKAKVKFDAHYCVSPIDPKPVWDFLKEYHPETHWDIHAKNFWKMVVDKGLPLRKKRWCCQIIKESGGIGRVVVVGNRRAEGRIRKNQCYVGNSNQTESVTYIRPIIDFDDNDVWQYIRENNVQYCSLYDEGATRKGYGEGIFKRLGCVMCPFSSDPLLEAQYNPKIASLWKNACDRIVEASKARGYKTKRGKDIYKKYADGKELYDWWVSRTVQENKLDQIAMFD